MYVGHDVGKDSPDATASLTGSSSLFRPWRLGKLSKKS